nr:transposase (putative), gypsy type [Tanacetum cinerariifolium]
MGRDTVQLETAVNTISHEYLLEFTSEYSIPEALHPELPRPEDRIVDFPKGKVGVYTKFFEFANFRLPLSQFLFDILGYYQIHLSQLSVIGATKQEVGEKYPIVLYQALGLSQKLEQPLFLDGREGVPDCRGLSHECSKRWDAGREHIFRRSRENTGYTPHSHQKIARGATLLSGTKPQILPGGRNMDMFSLIRAPNPTKVKTRSRPRATHEVPLLTMTANRVIEIEDPTAATDSSGVPSIIERSPLDFAHEAGAEDQGTMAPEVPPPEDVPTTRGAPEAGQAERVAATDPSAGESLAAIELGMGSTGPAPVPESVPADVSDPDPLSFADLRSCHPADGTAAAGDPEFENTSFASVVGSPESIYRHEWGIANGSILDTPEACQDLVDHVAPPGYFSELRHLRNDNFLRQYNVNLARQLAMGSQLRLRFEQEAKLLKKSVAQVARRDKRIQAREHEIKNLKALLEADANMKKAAKDKSTKLSQELENMRALFSDLQYEDNWVEHRCAEMDAHLDALSIDFDEELYPHMLTAIAGRRWMIGHGLRLAMAQLNLEAIEAYDPKAKAKYIAALQVLKNLKYPLVDQLEGLKDAPVDVIMAALHLESDTGDDAPQWVRKLRPSSSQLTIPVYPKVRDPMNPWACKEEMLLADAIATNVSRAKKKKKCRIVCRTHGVGSTHHAWYDGVPVSTPTVVPQGLAILLADAATQTEYNDATLNNLYVLRAPWESLRIPNVLGMTLRKQSPRPPGLQPVYAAGRV